MSSEVLSLPSGPAPLTCSKTNVPLTVCPKIVSGVGVAGMVTSTRT